MYDRRFSSKVANVRPEAVGLLRLGAGDVVVEAGCGTGRNFALILERIGPAGRIVGIDQSPEMLAEATRKLAANHWTNVELVQSPAQAAEIEGAADAILFYATHDILRSRDAIVRVLSAARPGARVVAAGTKWAPPWNVPVNVYLWLTSRRYITTFDGYGQPWSLLAEAVPDLVVDETRFGAIFIAHGTVPSPRLLLAVTIREATRAERALVARIVRDAGLAADGIADGAGRYWIAFGPTEEAVGAVGIEWHEANALVRSVAVAPAHRLQGYGSALVRHALGEARRAGCTRAYAFSTGAGSFFGRLGFVEVPVDEAARALADTRQVVRYRSTGALERERAWVAPIAAAETGSQS
jgi:demethylmenaquinone methyltransferase/2-methoxy-6-polyprenyl-1,4-benzoquinol methylase